MRVQLTYEDTGKRYVYGDKNTSVQGQDDISLHNFSRLFDSEVTTLKDEQSLNLRIYTDANRCHRFCTTVDVYDKHHLRLNGDYSLNSLLFRPDYAQDDKPLLELNLRIDTDGESEGSDGEFIGNVISEGKNKLRNVQLEQAIYFYYYFKPFITHLNMLDEDVINYLKEIRTLAEVEGISHLQAFNHKLSVDVFNEPLMTFSNRGVTDKSVYHAYFTSYTPETTIKKNVFQALTKRKRSQTIEDIINTYVKVKRSRIALPVHVERVSIPIRDRQTIETVEQSIYRADIHLTRTNKFLYELINRVSQSKISNDTTILHTSAQLLKMGNHLSLEGTFLTLTEEDTKRMASFYKSGMRAKEMGGFMFFNWSIFHSFVTNRSFMNVEVDKMSLPFIDVLNKHYSESSSKTVEQLQSSKSAVLSQLTRPNMNYEQTGCLLLTNEFEQNVYWNGLPELTKHSSIEHLYITSEFKALIDLNDIKPKLHFV